MSREQAEKIEQLLREGPIDLGGDLAEQRPLFEELLGAHPVPPGVRTGSSTLGGVPVVEIRPAGLNDTDGASVLLFFHGGGYALGSAASSVGLVADLAVRVGARAVTVDYRLAPENPYPAALDDAVAAYRGLLDAGVSGHNVIVTGESAGGGLAVAALLALVNAGWPQPAACVVFSPWVDLSLNAATLVSKRAVDPALTSDALRVRAADYALNVDSRDPGVSPLFGDLAGLPPMLIQVGSHEILLDDALDLAARAARADVAVTLQVTPHVPHVFQGFAAALDEAASALDAAALFVRAHTGPERLSERPVTPTPP